MRPSAARLSCLHRYSESPVYRAQREKVQDGKMFIVLIVVLWQKLFVEDSIKRRGKMMSMHHCITVVDAFSTPTQQFQHISFPRRLCLQSQVVILLGRQRRHRHHKLCTDPVLWILACVTRRSYAMVRNARQLTVFEQAHVVAAQCLDEFFCHVHLSQGQLVVVTVVQDVQQVCVERVNVLQRGG